MGHNCFQLKAPLKSYLGSVITELFASRMWLQFLVINGLTDDGYVLMLPEKRTRLRGGLCALGPSLLAFCRKVKSRSGFIRKKSDDFYIVGEMVVSVGQASFPSLEFTLIGTFSCHCEISGSLVL